MLDDVGDQPAVEPAGQRHLDPRLAQPADQGGVGLANYAYLLRQPTYHDALLNTLVYVHPGEVVGLHGASLLV